MLGNLFLVEKLSRYSPESFLVSLEPDVKSSCGYVRMFTSVIWYRKIHISVSHSVTIFTHSHEFCDMDLM